MRTTLVLLLAVTSWVAVGAQEAKIAEQPKIDIARMHEALPDKEYTSKTVDTSYVTPAGERVLRQEITVPATVSQVWEAFTTSAGLRTFVAPITEVELKTGGRYYTNYRVGARIGDPGTIYNTVLVYVPMEMLAIHVKLGTQIFPESVATADRLNAIVQIKDLGNGQARVTESMVGWQPGEDWDKVYQFFQTGNAYTLGQLLKRFTVGPRVWK